MTGEILRAVLSSRYQCVTEDELQEAIAETLKSAGVSFQREFVLGEGDRIDFLCGTVGIEVKIKGPISAVLRQLDRYLRNPQLTEIILATTKAQHRRTPPTLRGKRIHVAYLAPF